jgi:hypothetical protein
VEKPKSRFTQDRKKKVGPNKYKNSNNNNAKKGNKSKKKEKNKNSETKNIDPGKPKKIKRFTNETRKSFGQRKFRPPNSVINRVLNRRAIASTRRKEFADNKAWLINIQKLANIRLD